MAIAEQRERIGTTILDQLTCASGGAGERRLRAMVAARDICSVISGVTNEESVPLRSVGVGFRFKGCKEWNGIEIYLDEGRDEYIIRFYQIRLEGGAGTTLTAGKWERYYAKELCAMFTAYTGLDTHL